MKKRGVIELQIKWAFAVIIGVMLLLFFVQVFYKQNERAAYSAAYMVGSFIGKSMASGEADIEIRLPEEQKISSDCESSKLLIGKGSVVVPEGMVVFSKEFSADKIQMSKIDVMLPFLIGRAVLIKPANTRVLLAFDELELETGLALMRIFGDTVYLAELGDVETEDVISLFAILVNENDEVLNAIGLRPEGGLVFLEEEEGTWKVRKELPYISPELLAAAIAADPDDYECGVSRMLKRLQPVALRYEGKADALSGECSYPINELKILEGNSSYSNEGAKNIAQAVLKIKEANEILSENACEVLY
ncbi:hypothetical protein JXB11_02635 [Candidatus Woesearchaeota archaeon]|nr:hypothetical protein [Candidatus Woesearchaeota archaeon]